jgi:hypothetical protein
MRSEISGAAMCLLATNVKTVPPTPTQWRRGIIQSVAWSFLFGFGIIGPSMAQPSPTPYQGGIEYNVQRDPSSVPPSTCPVSTQSVLAANAFLQTQAPECQSINQTLLQGALQQCVPVGQCEQNPPACAAAIDYFNANKVICVPTYRPAAPAPGMLRAYIAQSEEWLPAQPEPIQNALAPKLSAMQQQCQAGAETTAACTSLESAEFSATC